MKSALYVCVQPNRALSLPDERPLRLTVQAGRIWLTVSGQRKDVFVSKGEQWVITEQGRAVVESVAGATVFNSQIELNP